MSRNIITEHDIRMARAEAGAVPGTLDALGRKLSRPEKVDDYKTKLMKYIPAEVIGLYVALEGIVKSSATDGRQEAYWFIFVVGLIVTPLYLWRIGKVDKSVQLLISTLAFAVWVFALGGPFESLDWYRSHRLYPALTLPIYTFLVAMINPK
jgi:hypothetical protein